jgi:hypothetical protein
MDNHLYKKWALLFLILPFCFLMQVPVNYIVDPYQLIRGDTVLANGNMRFASVGLARNHDYDSIIIGSSTTQNFAASYIDRKLNLNTVKLGVAGASAYEQNLLAREAISSGKVKFAIWGLDYFCFNTEPGSFWKGAPMYLYDRNPLKKMDWLMNPDIFTLSLKKVLFKYFHYPSRKFTYSMDKLGCWYDLKKGDFNFKHYKKSWNQRVTIERNFVGGEGEGNEDGLDASLQGGALNRMEKCFDLYMYSIIKAHPEVKFYVFYPPYSLLAYQVSEKAKADFYDYLAFKKYVFESLSGCPNVKLYDFQADVNLAHDFSRYMDLVHYDENVNRTMVDWFAEDRYLVTKGNVDQYISELRKAVESTDPKVSLKGYNPGFPHLTLHPSSSSPSTCRAVSSPPA